MMHGTDINELANNSYVLSTKTIKALEKLLLQNDSVSICISDVNGNVIYEENAELTRFTEILENSVNIKCMHCGKTHYISTPEVEYYDDKRDPHYVYEFYTKCECGKHLSGERTDYYLRYRDWDVDVPGHRDVTFKNCKLVDSTHSKWIDGSNV